MYVVICDDFGKPQVATILNLQKHHIQFRMYTLSIIISKSVGHADNFHFINTTNDTEFRFEIHLSVRESDALR